MVFSPTPERRATSFWLSPRSLRISLSLSTRSMASSHVVPAPSMNHSEPPHQTDHYALHRDVTGGCVDRSHHRVRRLQPDALTFAIEALERDFAAHVRDDHVAVVSLVPPRDDHQVAIENAVLDHRVAPYLQNVVVAARGQMLRHGDGLVGDIHLERTPRGDVAEERQLANRTVLAADGRWRRLVALVVVLLDDLDAALLVPVAADQPLLLEQRQMLVDRPV